MSEGVDGTSETPTAGIPPHRYTAALAGGSRRRWQDRWEREGTFHAPNPTGPLAEGFDRVAGRPQPLRAGHVPVPERRGPARRPPAGLHRHRRLRPVPADDRPQRPAHHGLRRVRPARRAVRGGDRAAPAHDHRGQHPDTTAGSCAGWAWATTTGAASPPPTSSFYRWTQWIFLQIFDAWYDPDAAGPARSPSWWPSWTPGSGEPAEGTNPSGRPWAELTSAERRQVVDAHRLAYRSERSSTGAPAWAPCWPTRRSPPTAAASAATSRSTGGR